MVGYTSLNEHVLTTDRVGGSVVEVECADADARCARLLATKLAVPPARPDLIARRGLIDRLEARPRATLTLVSAPAGFGKTTLLSDWLGRSKRPVAWVSLDAGDNDPTRFWSYVIAALHTHHGPEGTRIGDAALAMLHRAGDTPRTQLHPPAIETVLTALINALAALPEEITLVLDDYHVIGAEAIHQGLTFLLGHLPPTLQVVIATRVDPRLPLARLRAHGQLMELRAADLRFTPDEAAAFLNQGMGLGLAPEQVAALEARTEGWIAGLQLAALALQRHTDVPGFITAFTGADQFSFGGFSIFVLQDDTPFLSPRSVNWWRWLVSLLLHESEK